MAPFLIYIHMFMGDETTSGDIYVCEYMGLMNLSFDCSHMQLPNLMLVLVLPILTLPPVLPLMLVLAASYMWVCHPVLVVWSLMPLFICISACAFYYIDIYT